MEYGTGAWRPCRRSLVGKRLVEAEIDDSRSAQKGADVPQLGAARAVQLFKQSQLCRVDRLGRRMQGGQRIGSVAMLSHTVVKLSLTPRRYSASVTWRCQAGQRGRAAPVAGAAHESMSDGSSLPRPRMARRRGWDAGNACKEYLSTAVYIPCMHLQ